MLSRALIGAALAASLPLTSALADPLPVSAAEKVGLSSERLQRLTATLKAEVERGRLPGAVLAIARKGQLAYFETVGYVDAASKAPMPRDAIFSIASMTKPMVSVAKEQLAVVYMAATPGDIRTYYRSLVRNLVLQSIVD